MSRTKPNREIVYEALTRKFQTSEELRTATGFTTPVLAMALSQLRQQGVAESRKVMATSGYHHHKHRLTGVKPKPKRPPSEKWLGRTRSEPAPLRDGSFNKIVLMSLDSRERTAYAIAKQLQEKPSAVRFSINYLIKRGYPIEVTYAKIEGTGQPVASYHLTDTKVKKAAGVAKVVARASAED